MKPAARNCYSSLGEKKVYTGWVQHRKVLVGILIKYQQLKFIVKITSNDELDLMIIILVVYYHDFVS